MDGGRAVAVKVVWAGLAEDPGFRRRFVREVEAARRVSGFFTGLLALGALAFLTSDRTASPVLERTGTDLSERE
ncbi:MULTISPECIES: hypothetical protein [unclassified Spirillospora]|uniref:hypothetical protein n=1 Tax=unclassified Spirillospora TaxID=2642701 RepID=UPI00371A043E